MIRDRGPLMQRLKEPTLCYRRQYEDGKPALCWRTCMLKRRYMLMMSRRHDMSLKLCCAVKTRTPTSIYHNGRWKWVSVRLITETRGIALMLQPFEKMEGRPRRWHRNGRLAHQPTSRSLTGCQDQPSSTLRHTPC